MNALRVVIADDEPLARLRLRRLLGGIQGVEVVAECASGIEVMQLLPDCPCDLLLLDIQMPGADGFQALEHGVARRARWCSSLPMRSTRCEHSTCRRWTTC